MKKIVVIEEIRVYDEVSETFGSLEPGRYDVEETDNPRTGVGKDFLRITGTTQCVACTYLATVAGRAYLER